jgi:hypothetical protein
MTPQEELDQALAELAAANAELAKANAELADAKSKPTRPARKAAAKPKRPATRPVHRSDLRTGCYGTGERFTSNRVRMDMTPVVTKELNPMDRPNAYEYVGHECLFEHDIRNGNRDSDSWKRCKCAGCAEIRRG